MLGDRPTGGHRQHADQRGEHHQRQADAVEPHEVIDVKRRYPRNRKDILHLGDRDVERRRVLNHAEEHGHRQRQHDGGHAEGDVANRFFGALGGEGQNQTGHGRQENDKAENSRVDVH